MKTCSKCGQTKSLDSFYTHPNCKMGVSSICKSCHGKSSRRWQQANREKCVAATRRCCQKNPEKYAALQRRWRKANKEKYSETRLRWRQTNREKLAASSRLWRQENPGKCAASSRQWQQTKLASDPIFCLIANCRRRVGLALQGKSKSAKTLELIGCSVEHLRLWLTQQFQPGMTWENYGLKGWHVDHIKPCKKFDLTDPAQQRQCFNFTNLQPLWAEKNLRKGAKWPANES